MQTPSVAYKDLVLIGGGHSHALLLKMWRMKPLTGVRVTLISPQVQTPYSGMLPGLIAGHYDFDETHIDLSRLCRYGDVRFIQAAVTGIDPDQKEVHFAGRPPLGFDVLSINSGITPDTSIAGSAEHAIAVKPIASFYPQWQALVARLREQAFTQRTPINIAVAGGGAAGVELILAMQYALQQTLQQTTDTHTPDNKVALQFHLIQKGTGLPENYPARLQHNMATLFQARGIHVHDQCAIKEVKPNAILTESGETIPVDALFWCTQAAAAAWPRQSGLAVDAQGFIAINEYLQSTSHDFIFAAGDIAKQVHAPRPRAGVYAVRQAPFLFKNLRNRLLQQPLTPFQPQSHFLSLLACGDRYAMGCKPRSLFPTLSGHWVWRWKDHIDRKFMAQFNELQTRNMGHQVQQPLSPQLLDADQISATNTMRCGGCGAKVGASILSRTLQRLQPVTREGVMLGLNAADDAAAITVPPGQWLLQSVDVFKALVDDPYLQGQIAALHALSDLFAMNAEPHSAQAIVTLPYAAEALVERDLLQLMSGALQILNENQCALIGGHTSEGAELSLGFAVNGLAAADQVLRKSQAQPGDKLILTQALGTGILFAAHHQLLAQGRWIEAALQAMLQSNREAGAIFFQHRANACTDITGFGLAGHLVEMLTGNSVAARLSLNALPLLPGAQACAQNGIQSSLYPQNQRARHRIQHADQWQDHERWPLLFDPQTSGGLLASVPPEQADACLAALHKAGYSQAVIVGEIIAATDPADAIALTD